MLNEELLEFKNIAASRSHNIEELQIQLNELSVAQDEVAQRVVDNENWAVVRDELHRQADHLRAVESENSRMKSELSNLRKRQANAEILKEQIRELERKAHGAEQAREQVTILEAKLEAARKETEEWYIWYPLRMRPILTFCQGREEEHTTLRHQEHFRASSQSRTALRGTRRYGSCFTITRQRAGRRSIAPR